MMLEIDGWQVGIKFSAAHFIPEHGKCSRIHGHDYGIRLRIYGEVRSGILLDFVEVKRIARKIADELDHHILVPTENEDMRIEEEGNALHIFYRDREYLFPREDVVFVDVTIPSAEELARYIGHRLLSRLNGAFGENVKGIEICVDEGPGQGACEYFEVGD